MTQREVKAVRIFVTVYIALAITGIVGAIFDVNWVKALIIFVVVCLLWYPLTKNA